MNEYRLSSYSYGIALCVIDDGRKLSFDKLLGYINQYNKEKRYNHEFCFTFNDLKIGKLYEVALNDEILGDLTQDCGEIIIHKFSIEEDGFLYDESGEIVRVSKDMRFREVSKT